MDLTLRHVDQIAAFLPYLLGFSPHRSLVVVGIVDGAIGMTARVDLPDRQAAVPVSARHVAQAFSRGGHSAALLFAVCEGPAPTAVLTATSRRLRAVGIEVDHQAHLDEHGRWRAVQCGCGRCPRQWSVVPDLSTHPVVTQRIVDGDAPVATREELVDRLEVDAGAVGEVQTAIDRRRPPAHAEAGRALACVLYAPEDVEDLPADTLALACLAVQDLQVRDAVLGWLLPDMFALCEQAGPDLRDLFLEHEAAALEGRSRSRDQAPFDLQRRLEAWARCTPRPQRPAVLTLLAAQIWRRGGGALGSMVAERAMQIDPDYRLARLVHQALVHGVRPTTREDRRSA